MRDIGGDARTTRPSPAVRAGDEAPIPDERMHDHPNPLPGTPFASIAKGPDSDGIAPLFPDHARRELESRWEEIQAEFVDEPRQSVEEADRLVAETTSLLAESFTRLRHELEDEWKRGDDVSTEDLRRALRRYRSFFGRLVSA